jgi:hypothetical protein
MMRLHPGLQGALYAAGTPQPNNVNVCHWCGLDVLQPLHGLLQVARQA